MSKRFQTLLLTALALPLTLGLARAAQERLLKDSDLKKLGGALEDYFDALLESKGIDDAKAEVDDEIAKLEKKLKGPSLLSSPADIGYAYHLSRNYSKAKLKKGKVTTEEYEHSNAIGGKVEYAYWVPKNYNASKETYPLILMIPDEGESPEDHIKEEWLSSEVRDNAILIAVGMPADREVWNQMMADGKFGGLGNFFMGFRVAQEQFSVDFDRIFAAGRGAGVPAALTVANFFPHRFAGVIGRSGDAGEMGPENFSNLPTYFAGAGGNATGFQEEAKEMGFENVTIEPGGKETDVWAWMGAHPRNPLPAKVQLFPGNVEGQPFPNRAYWLGTPASQGTPKVSASVDRGSNTITVEGEGVSQFTLYLNDALVDLSKPVKVLCNGVENEVQLERRLAVTLDLLKSSTSDPACVFTTTGGFSLPPKSGGGE